MTGKITHGKGKEKKDKQGREDDRGER